MVVNYEGKVVLAPMVRIGTLPMRLLALEYGADLVWSPEMVDRKIITSQRLFNQQLGTYDYVCKKDKRTLIFRTHPKEKDRFIFQLGSSDPERALQAARIVREDVAGIDLNCGCPKRFSLQAGMGAALLRDPNRLVAILHGLVQGIPDLPITAKVRLLPEPEASLDLIRRIAETGIRALTVHCRTPEERPRHPAHYELIPEIIRICPFPVILNGDLFSREDIDRCKQLTGVSSVMLARAAQWNPSIFRLEGPLNDLHQVTRDYLSKCIQVDNPFNNTKYAVLQMWLDRPHSDKVFSQQLQRCKSIAALCALFEMSYIPRDMKQDDHPLVDNAV